MTYYRVAPRIISHPFVQPDSATLFAVQRFRDYLVTRFGETSTLSISLHLKCVEVSLRASVINPDGHAHSEVRAKTRTLTLSSICTDPLDAARQVESELTRTLADVIEHVASQWKPNALNLLYPVPSPH